MHVSMWIIIIDLKAGNRKDLAIFERFLEWPPRVKELHTFRTVLQLVMLIDAEFTSL